MSIFVLAGQSNMAGYGGPVPQETPNARVFDLTNGIRPAVDPLGDAPGVGPGRFFGLYLAHRGMRVGLVNCAVGGSGMDAWLGGLYQPCVDRVRAAERYGRVRGVLFFQGETDTQWEESASTWAARFGVLVSGFRRDFGARLPVVFAQLGSTTADPSLFPCWQLVQEQQASVKLPGVAMIETADLPLDPSQQMHFSVPSYAVIGRRFATTWLRVRGAAR